MVERELTVVQTRVGMVESELTVVQTRVGMVMRTYCSTDQGGDSREIENLLYYRPGWRQ